MDIKKLFAFGFLLMSLYFVARSFERRREIGACNGCKIDTYIVNNKCQSIGGGICVYYALYGYEIDGESYTYQSRCPSVFAMKLGTHIPMYYDHGLRKPVEGVSCVSEVTMAMVFGVAALILGI